MKRLADVAFLLLALRVLLVGGAAVGGTAVAAHSLAGIGGGTSVEPVWLAKAGPYLVERVKVPCPGVSVSRNVPRKGVGHTTEGSWAGAMGVFRHHFAPHFMVGRDGGRVRIVQFCPLNEISAALANRAGGVETNRWATVQIEVVGRSKRQTWTPEPEVLRAYSALLYELREKAGVPLRFCGALTSRDPIRWRTCSGWFNHANVPENDHWDMGSFDWLKALRLAATFAPIVNGGEPAKPPPPPVESRPYVVCSSGKCAFAARAGEAVELRLRRGHKKVTVAVRPRA